VNPLPTLAVAFALPALPLAAQRAEVREAPTVIMPAGADSNSPGFWYDGQFHILNSTGLPLLSSGINQFLFWETGETETTPQDHIPMWIEAVWMDQDGTLYAWYHHEPRDVCPGSSLTAPEIGALVSGDGGRTFKDLGIVLTAGDPVDCSSANGFFAGGHGDFSVILDQQQNYFYFLFGNYSGPLSSQGVAIARMPFAGRASPVGAVWKHFESDWAEPGLGGRVTPVFPAAVSWQRSDTDAFWGPSIHWNSHLGMYVVLLNHACCTPKWPQEGIYVSYSPDLASPSDFTAPAKILDADVGYSPAWYPQVLGTGPGETDTLAGEVTRLYVKGVSKWEIVFH
jgi:hypothetical protein